MDSDEWGVPPRMFGAVDEKFYGLVGRIAMVATLLEDQLHVLFCTLARQPQDVRAGDPGTTLISECQKLLGHFSEVRRDEAADFLIDARAALLSRHEVVHSLWPFDEASPGQGWCNVPLRHRQDPARAVEWTALHTSQLPDLLKALVALVERCDQLQMWATPS